MAAAFAARESDRLFWFDGAAVWIEPGRDADARGEEGQQIYSERREDVDHQRIDRGHRGRVGQRRRRQGARVSGGKRHTGIQDLGRARKMVAARFGDVGTRVHRLRNSRRKSFTGRRRIEGAAELLEPGALWNRLGRAGRGDGVLRYGAAVCEDAQAVCEQADRFAPTGAGKTGVDDYGDSERPVAGAARGPIEG